MLPRRKLFSILLAGSMACFLDTTGPEGTEIYLLRRIGPRPLPTYLFETNKTEQVIADTLEVPLRSIRDGASFVVRRVQVGQDPPQAVWRFEGRYRGDVASGALVVDTCPIGALCLANLVYAPFTLSIVGDSLVEVPPAGANWEPRVYGLVRGTGRVR